MVGCGTDVITDTTDGDPGDGLMYKDGDMSTCKGSWERLTWARALVKWR